MLLWSVNIGKDEHRSIVWFRPCFMWILKSELLLQGLHLISRFYFNVNRHDNSRQCLNIVELLLVFKVNMTEFCTTFWLTLSLKYLWKNCFAMLCFNWLCIVYRKLFVFHYRPTGAAFLCHIKTNTAKLKNFFVPAIMVKYTCFNAAAKNVCLLTWSLSIIANFTKAN